MSSLYDQDFHAWALRQAAALRRVADLRVNLPDVDIEHLAEEIEDMGREQAHAVESALVQIIEHLLKLDFSPAVGPRRGWRVSVIKQRDALERRLAMNPSLATPGRQAEFLSRAWRSARRNVVAALSRHGEVVARIPEDCPYSFENLADFDWWPTRDPERE